MIPRVVQFVVGVWLIAAPAVFGYGDHLESSERIAGPIAAAFAFVAIWEVLRPLRWAIVAPAVWLVVSPPILTGWGDPAGLNSLVCGAVLLAATPFGGIVRSSFGGGWSALGTGEPDRGDRPPITGASR